MNKERQLEIRTNLENLYKNYRFEIKVSAVNNNFIIVIFNKKTTVGSITCLLSEPMDKVYNKVHAIMKNQAR